MQVHLDATILRKGVPSVLLLVFLVNSLCIQAQTPQKINYQAIIRNSSGTPLANQAISLRFTILDGSPSGVPQFVETHAATSNAFGLVNLQIGGGNVLLGSMNGITWGTGNKYLQVDVDISGGSNYTSLATTELVSVPFAMQAARATDVTNAVTQLTAGAGIQLSGNTGGVEVSALYGGDGSASSLSRSDHTHAGQSWTSSVPVLLKLTASNVNPRGLWVLAPNATGATDAAIRGEIGSTTGQSVGVWGQTNSTASLAAGVFGIAARAGNAKGVYGYAFADNTVAIYGETNMLTTDAKAGVFDGPVIINGTLTVNGTLSKSGGSFKIDHPLDPANKNLYHSFVESPDMMNVYNGNITLDAQGEATVLLPDWFEALNKDFRYQLTPVGKPSPDLYVSQEITGRQFRIAGGAPGAKVSWQVTGIRNDNYANQHRIPVEEEKSAEEKAAYGKTATKPASRH